MLNFKDLYIRHPLNYAGMTKDSAISEVELLMASPVLGVDLPGGTGNRGVRNYFDYLPNDLTFSL